MPKLCGYLAKPRADAKCSVVHSANHVHSVSYCKERFEETELPSVITKAFPSWCVNTALWWSSTIFFRSGHQYHNIIWLPVDGTWIWVLNASILFGINTALWEQESKVRIRGRWHVWHQTGVIVTFRALQEGDFSSVSRSSYHHCWPCFQDVSLLIHGVAFILATTD